MIPISWCAGTVAVVSLLAGGAGLKTGMWWVQSEWDKEKAEQAIQAHQAEQEARKIEQRRASAVQEIQSGFVRETRQARAAAAAAQSERSRLLDAVAAIPACPAASDPQTTSGVDGTAVLRLVAGQCARALSQLAEAADSTEAKLVGLQDYVRAITKE